MGDWLVRLSFVPRVLHLRAKPKLALAKIMYSLFTARVKWSFYLALNTVKRLNRMEGHRKKIFSFSSHIGKLKKSDHRKKTYFFEGYTAR
jgi:hypothetical protein